MAAPGSLECARDDKGVELAEIARGVEIAKIAEIAKFFRSAMTRGIEIPAMLYLLSRQHLRPPVPTPASQGLKDLTEIIPGDDFS
jgi:hypothetical protein